MLEELRGPAGRSRTTVPWERWIELSANRVAGTRAWDLLRAASRATGERLPGLDTVLRLLADDGTAPLAREFDGTREELSEALYALVGHTLLREGRASWIPLWGGGTRLVCDGLADDGLRVLVAEALSEPPNSTGCGSTSHSWTWTPTGRGRPTRRIRGWRRYRAKRGSRRSGDGSSRPSWTPKRRSGRSARPVSRW